MKSIYKLKNKTTEEIKGFLFISPWIIGFLMFRLWPVMQSFVYSFTSFNIFNPPQFIGLDNFTRMVNDPLFWKSLSVTFTYVLISVPLKLMFALFIAIILSNKLRNINLYRTIYYLPSILGSSIAISVLWKVLFMRDGVLNLFLAQLGIDGPAWLGNPDLTLFTLSLLSVWQFGSSMIIFLAGLKQIPVSLYEAAVIDGAGRLVKFFKITLPLLTPMIFFNIIMQTIGAFQTFAAPFVIFGNSGSPLNCALLYVINIYKFGFSYFEMGYASALSWVLLIIVSTFSFIAFKLQKYWVYYES